MYNAIMTFAARTTFPFLNGLTFLNTALPPCCLRGARTYGTKASEALQDRWNENVRHREVKLLHARVGLGLPFAVGNMLFGSSIKAIVVDKELEEIDSDATLFLVEHQFRLLEKSSQLFQTAATAICDIVSLILFSGEMATPLAQIAARAVIHTLLGKPASCAANRAALENCTKKELEGGVRFYSAMEATQKIHVSLYDELFFPEGSPKGQLARIENALKERFGATPKEISDLKTSLQTKKIVKICVQGYVSEVALDAAEAAAKITPK